MNSNVQKHEFEIVGILQMSNNTNVKSYEYSQSPQTQIWNHKNTPKVPKHQFEIIRILPNSKNLSLKILKFLTNIFSEKMILPNSFKNYQSNEDFWTSRKKSFCKLQLNALGVAGSVSTAHQNAATHQQCYLYFFKK